MLLFSCWVPSLQRSLQLSLAVQLSGKAHEDSDYATMNAVVHWSLGAETDTSGEVVKAVTIFVFHLAAIGCSIRTVVIMWHVHSLN